MKNIYEVMIELQHGFNLQVDKDYLNKNLDWNNAIIAESGEMLESLGYKWWKKQEVDIANAKVEAIDLLHFVISEFLELNYLIVPDISFATCNTSICFKDYFEEADLYDNFNISDIKKLINLLNYGEYNRFFILKQIFKQLDMSNEDVYIAYIVKNCLNKFRQDNGYKIDTYIKDWNGKEDNVVAYKIAKEFGAEEGLFDQLYIDLSAYYDKEVRKQPKVNFDDNLDYFRTKTVN